MNIGQMLAQEKMRAERQELSDVISELNRAKAELRQHQRDLEARGVCPICFGRGQYILSDEECSRCNGTGKTEANN